jgi:hypothetical protein
VKMSVKLRKHNYLLIGITKKKTIVKQVFNYF